MGEIGTNKKDVVAAETLPPHPIAELEDRFYCRGVRALQESWSGITAPVGS